MLMHTMIIVFSQVRVAIGREFLIFGVSTDALLPSRPHPVFFGLGHLESQHKQPEEILPGSSLRTTRDTTGHVRYMDGSLVKVLGARFCSLS